MGTRVSRMRPSAIDGLITNAAIVLEDRRKPVVVIGRVSDNGTRYFLGIFKLIRVGRALWAPS